MASCGLGLIRGTFSGFAGGYQKGFKRSFTESCTRAIFTKGTPKEKAEPWCMCQAQYLLDHYTPMVLTKYWIDTTSIETQAALTEAAGACENRLR